MTPQQTVNGAEPQGLGPLLRGIVNDAQDLVKAQLDLVKSEITSDMRKTREAVAVFGAGVAVAFVGGLLLCLMLVFLLHWLTLPDNPGWRPLPLWACFGLVGAVITGGGAVMIFLGRQKFASFNPLPDESAQGIKETLEWKTNPK